MRQAAFIGPFPITTTGELAGGTPSGKLVSDYNQYLQWLDQGVQSLPDPSKNLPPIGGLETPWFLQRELGLLRGGTWLLHPALPEQAPSDYEYQLSPSADWLALPDWELPLPNQTLAPGSVKARARATGNLAASKTIGILNTLPKCLAPIVINKINGQPYTQGDLDTYFPVANKMLQLEVDSLQDDYVRVDYLTYADGLRQSADYQRVLAGISTFTQDMSERSGIQGLRLNVIGANYNTFTFIVNIQ